MSEMDAIIDAVSNEVNNNYDDEKKYKRNAKMSEMDAIINNYDEKKHKRNAKMSEMDAIINNYDEKKYKEESSTAYETSSPQQTEYTSDSFLLYHEIWKEVWIHNQRPVHIISTGVSNDEFSVDEFWIFVIIAF